MKWEPWIAWILTPVCLVLGFYFTILAALGFSKRRAQKDWIEADACVTACEAVPLSELLEVQYGWERILTVLGAGRYIAALFSHGVLAPIGVLVQYEYKILDEKFQSQEHLHNHKIYPPGEWVRCRVNPSQPREAAIQVSTVRMVLYLVVGIIMLIAGIFVVTTYYLGS